MHLDASSPSTSTKPCVSTTERLSTNFILGFFDEGDRKGTSDFSGASRSLLSTSIDPLK